MAHVITKQGKKITKKKQNKKYENKNKMCRGGGGDFLYLLCLISNTMPRLEQSSLQPSTDLHHRHLQTTSYNHLILLHLLISRKGKLKQQQARWGVEKPEGPSALQPTTESSDKIYFVIKCKTYYLICKPLFGP